MKCSTYKCNMNVKHKNKLTFEEKQFNLDVNKNRTRHARHSWCSFIFWNFLQKIGIRICKALITSIVCVCVKPQDWVLWHSVMVFTLNVSIFKNGAAKIKGKRKRRRYVWTSLKSNRVILKIPLPVGVAGIHALVRRISSNAGSCWLIAWSTRMSRCLSSMYRMFGIRISSRNLKYENKSSISWKTTSILFYERFVHTAYVVLRLHVW